MNRFTDHKGSFRQLITCLKKCLEDVSLLENLKDEVNNLIAFLQGVANEEFIKWAKKYIPESKIPHPIVHDDFNSKLGKTLKKTYLDIVSLPAFKKA